MGRYVQVEDVIAEYPDDLVERLSDDQGAGVIDTSNVERAIAWAEAYVDAKLFKFYEVPLSPVPDIVKAWVIDLAIWRLFQRWVDDERVTRKKEEVDTMLDEIAQGRMQLPGAENQYKGLIAYIAPDPINWPEPGGRL